jgi:hypothetical protein
MSRHEAGLYALTLDHTLEETRRLAYTHIHELYSEDGTLRPMKEWPKDGLQAAMTLLGLKRQALKDILEYLRHAGAYGQAPAQETNIAVNKMTVVPLERLSDEELAYYLALAEKGRALAPDIDSPRPAPGRLQAGAEG